ncbi:transporter substrate-binding domain-containing protein [Roseibium denhamense]|nr:transporter substrate-binding domain-containing protein [Roseibium denhamense]
MAGLSLAGGGGAAADDEIILVQDNAYPPYMSVTTGEPDGVYAAVIREALRRTNAASATLRAVPWTRATVLVEKGAAHGLVGSYYKPHERPWIRRWSEPLFREEVAVFCRKDIAQPGWIYPDDYKGLLFGNVTGYKAPGPRFFEMVDQGTIKLEEAQTTEQNLSKLVLGRIDCYVVERLATEILMRAKGINTVDLVAIASVEPAYIGYSEHFNGPQADAFIDKMDQAIKDMKEDGTVDRIVASYIAGS